MRNILNFNGNWSFTKETFAEIPKAVSESWESVTLPHTWNATDGQDGGNDYHRGTCLYAKSFKKDSLPESKFYYLEIRGANSSADVYLNGKKLASHDGGYSTWRVNMTDALADENFLVIAVDNAPNDRVYPQVADFTFYGGLYRDVNVICVDETHFDLDYYGTPGLKVTPSVSGSDAKVEIETWVTNKEDGQTLKYTICDKEDATVAELTTAETKVTLDIKDVTLWHGRKHPYLYTAKIELLSGDGVIDSISTRFGCRTYKVDPELGFILNGEEYALRGVSRHQDRWGIGNALLPEHHEEDIELICEMGATTIRLAHYQHDQYFYDLCDERGLVIWAEIPYISQHMPTARENTISQMTELITQNYNHPSIVVWGLSNEITMKGDTDPDLLENHRILNDLCHEMDKTRLTT
ncbi:MAG: glycoside hydrolase family 2 protein, partial [Ruminococcaceae bacterium]|nr:glycoside hydrolase family 2 protein [Oscillospiraceae bacterium]